MKNAPKRLAGALALALLAGAGWLWHQNQQLHFLPEDTSAFVATFSAPPAADSAQTRAELEELLELQQVRSDEQVDAARADRKTELARFYGALGLDPEHPPKLPAVEKLAQRVEDEVRIYVRAAKDHFRRLRPFVIEPRLQPCIDNVRSDLSYPSGHAAYAWAMGYLLAELVPERREALYARATEFARQRMVCGVHFSSDLAAGKRAAEWLLNAMHQQRDYSREAAAATRELRAALQLPPAN